MHGWGGGDAMPFQANERVEYERKRMEEVEAQLLAQVACDPIATQLLRLTLYLWCTRRTLLR